MKKRSLLSIACVLAALSAGALVSCSKPDASNTTSGGSGEKPLKLAFITANASDFWTIARSGVNAAKSEVPNVSIDFRIPSDGTAAEQTRILDDLIVRGMDGIAICPVDPSNQTEILDRAAEKALVVTQDSDAPSSKRSFYIGTDNIAAGKQAGEIIKKALPNGGKIMVFVGMKDAQNARDRIAGIKSIINGTGIEIVDVRTDDADRVRAKRNVEDTLVKYPDIDGLVGIWSYNGPAIVNAAREAGKTGKVKIICFDEEPDTLDGVNSGEVVATVVQQPYEFGRQAIALMAAKLRGDESKIPANKQIFVPTRVIDAANVDEFRAELDKLRGHGS
jgi:ribose transport system substrate-binding protein